MGVWNVVTAGAERKSVRFGDLDLLCPSGGMVDTEDLKSSAERRVGSSPALGTKVKGVIMIPDNMPELKKAFDAWMTQGSHEPPTNADLIAHDGVDIELLHHLATFIWVQAGGVVDPFPDHWRHK